MTINDEEVKVTASDTSYIVELDEASYIDLMRLVLKHPDDISLLTRTCVAYAKKRDWA